MVRELAARAKRAAARMAAASGRQKREALLLAARLLEEEKAAILKANAEDLAAAREAGISGAKYDRLRLDEKTLKTLQTGLRQLAEAPEVVGEITEMRTLENGLQVGRMRVPLGLIGFVYESRPGATVEAAGLVVKSGNAILLRGGKEAIRSNTALVGVLRRALGEAGLPEDAITLVPTTDREAVLEMLGLSEFIDVMIPRGGDALIRLVTEHARMPVLYHAKGVNHLFVDEDADLEMAVRLAVNGKVQRPGVCNALETLLVHERVAEAFLPRLAEAMFAHGVELRGDARARAIVPEMKPATEEDWAAEYLDLILAVRVVPDMEAALAHIETYGTHHTEVIVTENYSKALRFLREVDASLVLVNASPRLNDGFQLGLGAEIGISTTKLHAYGPMGVRELTTTKWVGLGSGQERT